MKRKICFRADASVQIGYGHFVRTLALANMLKEEYDCTFFTQLPTRHQITEVGKVCELVELPANENKFDDFLNYLTGDELVVLDNYFYSSEYEKVIKDKGCKLISIGANDRHYYADVIVNFTNLKPSDFSAESYTKFCLGLNWSILRCPFYNNKIIKKKNGFVICIGGTDQFAYSEQFYECLENRYPEQEICIIATDRIGIERINAFNKRNVRLLLNLSAEQMARQFAKAEVAIVSASSVALEALSQGAEVIAGTYVDNQINIYHALNEDGYIWGVGSFNDDKICERVCNSIDAIKKGKKKKKFVANNTVNLYKKLFRGLCK